MNMRFARGDILIQTAMLHTKSGAGVMYIAGRGTRRAREINVGETALVLGEDVMTDSGIELWEEYRLLWRGKVWTISKDHAHKAWKSLD